MRKCFFYAFATLAICSILVIQYHKISSLTSENEFLTSQIVHIEATCESYKTELSIKEDQLVSLQELIKANEEEFLKYKEAEEERVKIVKEIETVYVEKGSENQVGVVSSKSSEAVKQYFNKKFEEFNKREK